MAVKLTTSSACAPLARASCAQSVQSLGAAQWRLAMLWLDRIDATGPTDDRAALLRGLRSTQPAMAGAVLHLLELRDHMIAANFLAGAWPAVVVSNPDAVRRAADSC